MGCKEVTFFLLDSALKVAPQPAHTQLATAAVMWVELQGPQARVQFVNHIFNTF